MARILTVLDAVVTVALHLWVVAAFVVIVPVATEVMYLSCLLLLARNLRK